MKKSKKQYYLEETDKIQKQFTRENQQYFNDLRSYMTFNNFLYDEETINQQIYAMAGDLLAAQAEEVSAVVFFGNEPKEMADELIENMPKSSLKERLRWVVLITGLFWLIKFFIDFSGAGTVVINPLDYLFDLLLVAALLFVAFKISQQAIYAKSKLISNDKFQLTTIFIFMVVAGIGIVFSGLFIPKIVLLRIAYPFDLIACLVLVAGVVAFTIAKRKRDYYPALVLLITLGLQGMFKRIAISQHFVNSDLFILTYAGIFMVGMAILILYNRKG